MRTYILGGGPAGMAVADGLADADAGPFVLIERGPGLGGLAQTLTWDGVGKHDLGPHKIFSIDKALVERVEALLEPDDWLECEKRSSVYMAGHYLPYPPSPFSLAGVFGLWAFGRMVAGYGCARVSSLFSKKAPATFEEDLVGRLGSPLYEILFKPIAEKLWGDPATLDAKLSKGRVQTPSLTETLGRLLKVKSDSQFEALNFRYPEGGLGRIWSAIETKSKQHGTFLMKHSVLGLDVEGNRISAIRCAGPEGERVFEIGPDDEVVSSLPLALIAHLLGPALTPEIRSAVDQIVNLNDLILVFLHLDTAKLLEESWIFVPDKRVAFHRISEQASFDPGMTPDGTIVCCEIMSNSDRPFMDEKDGDLVALVQDGLRHMKISTPDLKASRVVRLPKSYPVFHTGFEAPLARTMEALDRIENFRSIGRQGAFNYIGTLDAMDIGYGYAAWLAGDRKASWTAERKRTSHYPILD